MGLLLAGCKTPGEYAPITMYYPESPPDGEGRFTIVSENSGRRTAMAIDAENERLEMMNKWVKKNHYCPKGYTIIDRAVSFLGDRQYQVDYDCKCL
ncbi:hypothetical protein [Spongorhabdus nitratireducens]